VKVALRILRGQQPGSIKTAVQGREQPVYDWRELRRWHINEARLPAGSTIRFRQPTEWELYKTPILGALALFAFEAILIFLLARNLVKRRRAERFARESEERLSLATGAANVGLWMRDISHDKVWASPNWRSIFGFTEDAILCYQTILQRIHPDDQEGVARKMEHAVNHRTDYFAEYRLALPDGSQRWISSRGRAYSESNGKTQRMGGTSIDITERRLAESQLQEQREQLAHASRLSNMGELATSIAHELNQPLGSILSNTEAAELLLNQDPLALGDLRDILRDIRQNDERASEIIRRMGTLLRKHELNLQPLEMNLLAEDVLRLVSANAASRAIVINTELAQQLPPILGDRVHLEQVLLNLIMNAMEAVEHQPPERRRLTVSTSLPTDKAVELSVSDSGPGIEPLYLPRLFEPFFTTKESGIGIGLSIAHKIVTAHNGRIRGENHLAGGAIFHVVLPAIRAEVG
jgi:PAS domain S-box-containing protein